MEKKHSQGEFSVKKCTNDGYRVQINGAGSSGGCKVIAWTRKEDYCPLPCEEEKANAELICTAVNSYYPMLEALKKAIEVLDKVGYAYCKNHDGYATEDAVDNGWDDSIVEEMKSIISKAENK